MLSAASKLWTQWLIMWLDYSTYISDDKMSWGDIYPSIFSLRHGWLLSHATGWETQHRKLLLRSSGTEVYGWVDFHSGDTCEMAGWSVASLQGETTWPLFGSSGTELFQSLGKDYMQINGYALNIQLHLHSFNPYHPTCHRIFVSRWSAEYHVSNMPIYICHSRYMSVWIFF